MRPNSADIVRTPLASPKDSISKVRRMVRPVVSTPGRVAFRYPNASQGCDMEIASSLMCSASSFNTKLYPLRYHGSGFQRVVVLPSVRWEMARSRIRLVFELEGFHLARWLGIGMRWGGGGGRGKEAEILLSGFFTFKPIPVVENRVGPRNRHERNSSRNGEYALPAIGIEISGRRQWEVGVDGEDAGSYLLQEYASQPDRDGSVSTGDDNDNDDNDNAGDKEGYGIH